MVFLLVFRWLFYSPLVDRPRWLSWGGGVERRRGDSRLIKNTKEKGRGQQVKLENRSPVSEQQI